MTATCALHFDAPSIATCARCGRFCCSTCLRAGSTCDDCAARLRAELPALEGRAGLARYGLWATAACHGLMIVFAAAQLATGDVKEDSEGLFATLSALAAVLYLPVYVTTIVLVCRWFHLATRHALARGGQLGVTPGGAVGSWFIPFVNLVKPFTLTRQLYATAHRPDGHVAAWQTAWIVGNMASNVSVRLSGAPGLGVNIVSDAVLVVAALLCARVIAGLRFD